MTAVDQQAALDRARAGDAEALGQLLNGYRPYVRLLVRALRRGRIPERLDDSDLIQDALVEVNRHFGRFSGSVTAEFTAWLRVIVLRAAGHTLRSHLGTGKRDGGREEAGDVVLRWLVIADSTPSQQAIQHEQTARLADALARLPADMQEVLLGRHSDELSHAVLAERLGRTEAAVRVLYTRALRRLREACGED